MIALLLVTVFLLASALMLLRYKPETSLPYINRYLQSYQIQILQFNISQLGWNKLEFTQLAFVTASQQRLQLSNIKLYYSLPARQLNSLTVDQFELRLPQVESAAAANTTLDIEPYLRIWRQLPALSASVESGRVVLQGKQLQFSLNLDHGKRRDLLRLNISDKSFVFNTLVIHSWQEYSRFELKDTVFSSRQSGQALLELQQLSLQQRQQHYRVQLQSEVNLVASWQALAPWLSQLPVKPVLAELKLQLDGELVNDFLDFKQHRLKAKIQSKRALEFELQVPAIGPIKQSAAAVKIRLPQELQLKWQQGLQLTSGSLALQLKHAFTELSASLVAGACDLEQCQARYKFLIGKARWPAKELPVSWHSLSGQGSASWQQQRLALAGDIKAVKVALRRKGLVLSAVDFSAPKVFANIDLSQQTPLIKLQLPAVVIDETQLKFDSALLKLKPSLNNISLAYQKFLTLRGEYKLTGVSLQQLEVPLPELQVSGAWDLNGNSLEFATLLNSDRGAPLVGLKGRHSLDSGTGSATLNSRIQAFDNKAQRLSKRFMVWPYEFDLLAGQLGLQSSWRWSLTDEKPSYSVTSNLKLDNVGAVYQDIIALGLDYSGQLSFDGQQWGSAKAETVTLRQLDVGLAIDNIQATLKVSGVSPNIELTNFSAQLLQGSGKFGHFNYEVGSIEPQALNMQLRQLQLAELIDSAEYEGLEAQASISGDLPLVLTGSVVTMKDGKVYADKPGYVRYTGLQANDNQLLGLVSEALSNYHFASLNSTAQYRQDGNLDLAVRMLGENPDMKQKVNVNLNLNYDIPSLLRSLRAGRAVSDMIEAKLKTE